MNFFNISFFKQTACIILLSVLSFGASACDICGCFMGITPYDNQSSIGLLYRYRSFNGYGGQTNHVFPNSSSFFIPADADGKVYEHSHSNPSDYEIFRTAELRARYFVHRRIELNAIVPYNSNSSHYHDATGTVSGIGDVNLFGGYHLIRKLDNKGLNQRLIAGVGIKLATGKSGLNNLEGDTYPLLQQPGTGSTDGFVYINYMVGYKKFGASLNSSYKVNGTNHSGESIANSTTQFLNVFFNQSVGKNVKIVPSVQTFYEYSGGEKLNGVKTGEHVTNNLMTGLGMDIFIKNISINTGIQLNAYNGPTDHPQSAGKVHLGVTYNFNQLFYMLK